MHKKIYEVMIMIMIMIFFLFACRQKEKKITYLQSKVEKFIGLNVSFPKSVVLLDDLNEKEVSEGGTAEHTIIAFYDGDCGVCYVQLLKWSKIINIFKKQNLNFSYKFILLGNSSAVLKANLENVKFSLSNIYHDEKGEFANNYPFLLDRGYDNSAMLLGENDKILFIGNPTISQEVNNRYIELMKKNK